MKKLRLALAAAVVAFLTVIAPTPAQAYPGVTVTVSTATVIGGDDITITATVDPKINCDWDLTFLGEEVGGSGTSVQHVFDTPEVNEETKVDAIATCTFDDGTSALGGGGTGSLGASLVTVEQSVSGVGTQTLLPLGGGGDDDDDGSSGGGGDDGGLLPNTGGERLAWLVIGGLLVLVGAGVVVASRRRDSLG